jgi:hypothetical protein
VKRGRGEEEKRRRIGSRKGAKGAKEEREKGRKEKRVRNVKELGIKNVHQNSMNANGISRKTIFPLLSNYLCHSSSLLPFPFLFLSLFLFLCALADQFAPWREPLN